ncbi:hypothetical protein Sango_2695500 [Sesamum angolense]|uniref:SUZ domain-containing protein n=1 Tax=Sesamum angolense TaxID=2727404 RepID=A0AAE2BHP4_9LAMI|nr:hypothetical protein Sango_2695500 [Sesamum angolense]
MEIIAFADGAWSRSWFLVKDNIPCKHLILSIEQVLVNFLHDDTKVFSSVCCEGEDRHLILERCPESSIPPILVTDLLWQSGEVQSGEVQSPLTFDVLSREKVIPGQRDNSARECSLEERETTYLAARQRIFSAELYQTELVKQRPRNDPVVARRMITHALGKTNKVVCHVFSSSDTKEYGPTAKDWNIQQVDEATICSSNKLEGKSLSAKHPITCTLSEVHKSNGSELSSSVKEAKQKNLVASGGGSASERKENSIAENHLQKEHMGAAKRDWSSCTKDLITVSYSSHRSKVMMESHELDLELVLDHFFIA